MTSNTLRALFLEQFDVVGVIDSKTYFEEARKTNPAIKIIDYKTMVVLGLSYPKRIMKHTSTHLVPSFYTFGSDYHQVLKTRIDKVMKPLDLDYISGVDNHPYDERLAAVLSGVGFFGKNQLIINESFGSYMFLGIVFIDMTLDHEFILDIQDDCGSCKICINACPTQALYEGGYDMKRCISYYNQEKIVLSDEEIQKNHSLFGCDICQVVCPKNINKGTKMHFEFELSGKERVSITDLFDLSQRAFKNQYGDMAYLWKGKTILLRNALMVMLKQKNTQYISNIEESISNDKPKWYNDTAIKVLEKLKSLSLSNLDN